MKLCKKCGRELSEDYFNKNASSKDGLQAYCKECQRKIAKDAYYAKNKENKIIPHPINPSKKVE